MPLRKHLEQNHPAPQAAPRRKPSLTVMLAAQDEQLSLCRELEDIADSLPSSVNRQKCIFAAQALGSLMRSTHDYEEKIFFPWLAAEADSDDRLEPILARLKFEHCEDECYAEELTDVLMKLGRGEPVNMEATGYMLRGFFEARRRHIAFERDHLMKYIRP
jgi:hypothetical protein